jgi:hypothetical protein
VPRRSGPIGKKATFRAAHQKLSPEGKANLENWLNGLSEEEEAAILR